MIYVENTLRIADFKRETGNRGGRNHFDFGGKSTHAYRVYRERKKPKKQTIYTLYTIKRDYKVFKKGK